MVLPRWSSSWPWEWGKGSCPRPRSSAVSPGLGSLTGCQPGGIGGVAGMPQSGAARPFGGPLARPPAVSAGRSRVREAPGGGAGSGLSRCRGGDGGKRPVRGRGCRGDAPEQRRPGCRGRRENASQGKGAERARGFKSPCLGCPCQRKGPGLALAPVLHRSLAASPAGVGGVGKIPGGESCSLGGERRQQSPSAGGWTLFPAAGEVPYLLCCQWVLPHPAALPLAS